MTQANNNAPSTPHSYEHDLTGVFNKTCAIRDTVRKLRQNTQQSFACGPEDDPLWEIEKRISLCMYVLDRHLGDSSPARRGNQEMILPLGLTRPNAEKVYRHLTDLSVKTTVLQGVLAELEDLTFTRDQGQAIQTLNMLFDLYPPSLKAS